MLNVVKKTVSLLGFPQLLSGEYVGSGEGTLTSSADIAALAEADLSANTDLNSTAVLGVQGAAEMSATFALGVSEGIVDLAASIMVGTSNLVATLSLLHFGEAELDFESSLTADPVLVYIATTRPLSGQLTLSATMFEPLNILNLPVVEYVYTEDRLLKRYGINSGQSLTITGTSGKIVEYQTIDEIEDADYYYGGGRRHVLNDTEVAAVQNAGFGDLLTIENL